MEAPDREDLSSNGAITREREITKAWSSGGTNAQRRKDAERRKHPRVKACGDKSSEMLTEECCSVQKCEVTEAQSYESVEALALEKSLGRNREDADSRREKVQKRG